MKHKSCAIFIFENCVISGWLVAIDFNYILGGQLNSQQKIAAVSFL